MQSKGAIKFFSVALAIVCLYQLSFTLITKMVESDAREFAKSDAVKERNYLDSIAGEPVFNILIKKYTYRECKEREINLGLDLKGGMNVTMEVSVVDLVKSMSNFSKDPTFNKAIASALEKQKNSQEDFVTLFGKAFAEIDPNGRLAAIFSTKDLQDKVNYNSTNAEVLKIISTEANSAIDRSFNILRTRIDKFGVTQPNIQKIGSGRILIELPGIKEPERVRKLLQGTAKLEFWETYDNSEIYPFLVEVNNVLKASAESKNDTLKKSIADSSKKETAQTDKKAPAKDTTSLLSKLKTTSKDSGSLAKSDTSKAKAYEKFSKENPLWSVMTPSMQQDEQGKEMPRQKGPVLGYVLAKDTGKINRFFAMNNIKAILPKEFKGLWSVKPIEKNSYVYELIAIRVTNREGKAPLEGDAITDARQDFGQFGHSPEINMSMNIEGAKTWKRLTRDNIKKSIAIVLDDKVYSYPTVQGEIAGGRSSITGRFDINEAKDLANILKAGKLPAPAKIVEEAIVGPSLGKEAISSGLNSFLIALALVLVFMVFYYSNAGMNADLALFANIFIVMGVLASLGAVLTLPGIAGIVLTIGMSVDANVLIYERIREELSHGKGVRLAISDGYKHAYSSIIDSNVTTLLVGIILYIFGSGPIQGFATTLVIGILASMFTAIFITRLIFEWQLNRNKTIKFSNRFTEGAFKNVKIDFVKSRKWYYIISGTIITFGIISIIIKGFNFGVDFKGGRTYTVQMNKDLSATEIREALTAPFGSAAPEVKTVNTANRFKITTSFLISDINTDTDDKVLGKLNEGLAKLDPTATVLSSQKVGPTIADDIKVGAVFSILFSLIVIFLYILLRFKKWQFSLGAIISLIHDVLLVLSFFSILNGVVPFSLEIDQAFIAAILTVIGFSVTDTVVVFDRIRENLGQHYAKKDVKPLINTALNATLSRTINTSLTVFFVLFAIFVFGGEVIRGFSFALLIGIIVGTYSSVCIATPIIIDFDRSTDDKGEKNRESIKA